MAFPFLADRSSCTHPWDEILFETSNFVVVPTVGAIVEGWLLIVTKDEYISMGALPDDVLDELAYVIDVTRLLVSDCYGSAVVFEHGPVARGQRIGCSVDHAHIHVLPSTRSLIAGVPDITDVALEWTPVDRVHAVRKLFDQGKPYLYVEQPHGQAKIAVAEGVPSQLFRRVIAHREGLSEKFNWREFPMESNVLATLSTIRRIVSNQTASELNPV